MGVRGNMQMFGNLNVTLLGPFNTTNSRLSTTDFPFFFNFLCTSHLKRFQKSILLFHKLGCFAKMGQIILFNKDYHVVRAVGKKHLVICGIIFIFYFLQRQSKIEESFGQNLKANRKKERKNLSFGHNNEICFSFLSQMLSYFCH